MEKKTIGSFIAVLRKSNGITQQELADRLGVSNKTVSKWECDDSLPDLTLIPVIAEIFNVTTDEILTGGRINKEVSPPKDSVKIEREVKRIFSITSSKFYNLFFCAVAMVVLGLILHFTISYGAFRPYIGFGIFMVLFLASLILTVFNLNITKTSLADTELLEPNDNRISNFNEKINKYTFTAIMLNLFLFTLALPLGFGSGDAYAVVTFEYYLRLLLPYFWYAIPFYFGSFIVYTVFSQKNLNKAIQSNPQVKRSLSRLNKISLIFSCIFVGIILISIIIALAQLDTTIGIILVFPYAFLCAIEISYLIIRKKILKNL